VNLPIVINDRWCDEALQDYAKGIRADAPYLPNNFDFVARNNGLDSVDELRNIILSASYMCLGLGDVYLGCPCACPVDPRHRIVNPKFNPARTYTPEGAVGIGGAFMCIYPLASPGGYQLVGRSLPIWNMHTVNANFEPGKPWLLRHFDQIRFHEVSHTELEEQFEAFRHGVFTVGIEDTDFCVREYNNLIADPEVKASTETFVQRQKAASAIELAAEQEYWETAAAIGINDKEEERGSLDTSMDEDIRTMEENPMVELVRAELCANVWEINTAVGQSVKQGDPLIIFEAMKMEYSVEAPCDGVVCAMDIAEGSLVNPGAFIMAISRQLDVDIGTTAIERTHSYRNIARTHSKRGGPRFDNPLQSELVVDADAKDIERSPSYRNIIRTHSKKGGPRFQNPLSTHLEYDPDTRDYQK